MIGGRRAQVFEVRAAVGDCAYEAAIIASPQRVKLGRGDLEQRVRPERRDHATLPARLADRFVVLEAVGRRVGRRQYLDVEALEQRAWPELGRGELLNDLVVDPCCSFSGYRILNTEYPVHFVFEPCPARRAAKQIVALG